MLFHVLTQLDKCCTERTGEKANDRRHIFSSFCNTPATKTTIETDFIIEIACVDRKRTQRAI